MRRGFLNPKLKPAPAPRSGIDASPVSKPAAPVAISQDFASNGAPSQDGGTSFMEGSDGLIDSADFMSWMYEKGPWKKNKPTVVDGKISLRNQDEINEVTNAVTSYLRSSSRPRPSHDDDVRPSSGVEIQEIIDRFTTPAPLDLRNATAPTVVSPTSASSKTSPSTAVHEESAQRSANSEPKLDSDSRQHEFTESTDTSGVPVPPPNDLDALKKYVSEMPNIRGITPKDIIFPSQSHLVVDPKNVWASLADGTSEVRTWLDDAFNHADRHARVAFANYGRSQGGKPLAKAPDGTTPIASGMEALFQHHILSLYKEKLSTLDPKLVPLLSVNPTGSAKVLPKNVVNPLSPSNLPRPVAADLATSSTKTETKKRSSPKDTSAPSSIKTPSVPLISEGTPQTLPYSVPKSSIGDEHFSYPSFADGTSPVPIFIDYLLESERPEDIRGFLNRLRQFDGLEPKPSTNASIELASDEKLNALMTKVPEIMRKISCGELKKPPTYMNFKPDEGKLKEMRKLPNFLEGSAKELQEKYGNGITASHLRIVSLPGPGEHSGICALLPGVKEALEALPSFQALPAIPRGPAYSILPIEGKGVGILCTRLIKRGELIMTERPVTVMPQMFPRADMLDQVTKLMLENLHKEDVATFMSLANCKGPEYNEIFGRMNTNNVGIKLPPDETVQYGAVFLNLSRCNHSCSPNAVYEFNQSTFAIEVVAAHDIHPSEEICVTYVKPLAPRSQRIHDLQDRYTFTCTCKSCSLSPKLSADSDARRQVLRHEDHMKRAFQTWIEGKGESDQEFIQAVRHLLEFAGKEGVEADTSWYLCLMADVYAALGQEAKYKKSAAKARDTIRYTGVLADLPLDPTKHPMWKKRKT